MAVDAAGGGGHLLGCLPFVQAPGAEAFVVVDGPLFGVRFGRAGQYLADAGVDVGGVVGDVDPGAEQAAGVVVGQAGDVDAPWGRPGLGVHGVFEFWVGDAQGFLLSGSGSSPVVTCRPGGPRVSAASRSMTVARSALVVCHSTRGTTPAWRRCSWPLLA